jgi:hypothetical protein
MLCPTLNRRFVPAADIPRMARTAGPHDEGNQVRTAFTGSLVPFLALNLGPSPNAI